MMDKRLLALVPGALRHVLLTHAFWSMISYYDFRSPRYAHKGHESEVRHRSV